MKTIIITGAGSGLGKELALQYSSKGYHLLLIGRTESKLKEIETQIKDKGGYADSVVLDITNDEAVHSFVRMAHNQFDLYGLINNAGVGHFGPFEKMTATEIMEMLHTNVLGTIYMSQALLPVLQGKEEALLMNIISTAGLKGKVNEAGYVASKFAVRGLTESLQKEYEHTNVKIKAVYMGGMDTPFWDHNDHIQDKSRLRSPADVAEMIIANTAKDEIIIESK
ncbi:short-subunit dehydrogenase [Cytobacillus eiseniae]|uniref:Short-subunit dehydrogenase n=1 Tax=Cytobacillus eiseniae TaxID=762947 RepID=A0ABS4RK79_9BACI|nr:SDR family NAD(P)-dependent oxidoreductase [Cytobacillus eiseniae]MBP2242699.1 short-subunit dehydrogenase [Cytobacillus eiseniae]